MNTTTQQVHQSIIKGIEKLEGKQRQLMDWPGLEQHIRNVLTDYRSNELSPEAALGLISEYLGAHTRRGYVLPCD